MCCTRTLKEIQNEMENVLGSDHSKAGMGVGGAVVGGCSDEDKRGMSRLSGSNFSKSMCMNTYAH